MAEKISPVSLRLAEKIAGAGGRRLGDEIPIGDLPWLVSPFSNSQKRYDEIAQYWVYRRRIQEALSGLTRGETASLRVNHDRGFKWPDLVTLGDLRDLPQDELKKELGPGTAGFFEVAYMNRP